MEQVKSNSLETKPVETDRKPYQRPQLSVHGKIEQITHITQPRPSTQI